MRFEQLAGGRRLVEVFADGHHHLVGRVVHWEPGARLAFEYRGRGCGPDEFTLVTVTFVGEGDETALTLVHSGWARFPADHPRQKGAFRRLFPGGGRGLVVPAAGATLGMIGISRKWVNPSAEPVTTAPRT